jgi:hypothetical protein
MAAFCRLKMHSDLPGAFSLVFKRFRRKYSKSSHQETITSVPSERELIRQRHRIFFDNLAHKLKIKNWEDWYKVSNPDIAAHNGAVILAHYCKTLYIR